MNISNISRRLNEWVDAGYITPEQSAQILSAEQKKGAHISYQLMYWIAGLLIGLGIILLISANWSQLSDTVKLLGDFAVWFGLIGGLTKVYNDKSKLVELFLTLCFLFTGASIGLISQIYHLNGGWDSFALSWALLSLPFILFSHIITLNVAWIIVFLFGLPKYIMDIIEELIDLSPTLTIIILSVAFGCISYFAQRIYEVLKKQITLPLAVSYFALFALYEDVLVFGGLVIGSKNNFNGYICLLYAFGFLGVRLLIDYSQKNMTSFLRDTYLAEYFIILVFLSRFGDLFLSGLGFISGGIFILGCLWVLKKTSKYIKQLEFFK